MTRRGFLLSAAAAGVATGASAELILRPGDRLAVRYTGAWQGETRSWAQPIRLTGTVYRHDEAGRARPEQVSLQTLVAENGALNADWLMDFYRKTINDLIDAFDAQLRPGDVVVGLKLLTMGPQFAAQSWDLYAPHYFKTVTYPRQMLHPR